MFAKIALFLKTFGSTRSFKIARHRTFHHQAERWSMIQFRDGSDQFYHSKHRITCDKCRFEQTTHQLWPKFNADIEQGYQLTDAHRQASQLSPSKEAA